MLKTIGTFLGVVAAVALAFFGYQWFGKWQVVQMEKWKAQAAAAAAVTAQLQSVATKRDTIYLAARAGYTTVRSRAVAAGPLTSRDSTLFAMCDQVVQTCDERHAADTAVAAALRAELKIARDKPSEKPKRLELRVGALYDVARASPLFRTDANLRLIGPISVAAEGELAIPPASQCIAAGTCGVTMRARVGVWYKF